MTVFIYHLFFPFAEKFSADVTLIPKVIPIAAPRAIVSNIVPKAVPNASPRTIPAPIKELPLLQFCNYIRY